MAPKKKAIPVAVERTEICKNCRHAFVKRGEDIKCRFLPPSFVYDVATGCTAIANPIVDADHWCGQFAPHLSS
jgi:hypothetical protein